MAGQTTTGSETTKTTPAKKVTKEPPPVTIPANAVPLPDGSYRFTDKAGKKWIYRNTPFGVSKAEEKETVPPIETISADPVKTEDLGDSVRFTRPTPFGPKAWVAKKDALDSYEQSIWNRDQEKTKQNGSSTNGDSKTSSQNSNK